MLKLCHTYFMITRVLILSKRLVIF